MSALVLGLWLAGAAAAHCGHCGPGAGDSHGGGPGAGRRARNADRKQPFTERADLPKDEGSKVYETPPEAAATAEEAPATPPALSTEDARDNIRTLLEARLNKTGGLWRVKDAKSGKLRALTLQGLGAAKDEGAGRWSAAATFRDKTGAARARVLVDLSGERWRVVSLEPETAAGRR